MQKYIAPVPRFGFLSTVSSYHSTQHCFPLLSSSSCVPLYLTVHSCSLRVAFLALPVCFLDPRHNSPLPGNPAFIMSAPVGPFFSPQIYSCVCICHRITSSHNLKKIDGSHLCFYHKIVFYLECLWSMWILNSSGYSGTDCSRQRLLLRITTRALFKKKSTWEHCKVAKAARTSDCDSWWGEETASKKQGQMCSPPGPEEIKTCSSGCQAVWPERPGP